VEAQVQSKKDYNLKEDEMKKYVLEIEPAIKVEHRHEIEKLLEKLGYDVDGGGQTTDGSSSDISFRKSEMKEVE